MRPGEPGTSEGIAVGQQVVLPREFRELYLRRDGMLEVFESGDPGGRRMLREALEAEAAAKATL